MGSPLPLCPPALPPTPRLIPPYGWRFRDGGWVPHEEEQRTLQRIFELHEGGARLIDICRTLTTEGIFTRKGTPWVSGSIRWILLNAGKIANSSPRPRSATRNRLSSFERAELEQMERVERGALFLARRPRRRGECEGHPGFCPFFRCKYNLGLDVDPENGTVKVAFPEGPPERMEVDVDRMGPSCALDLADKGGLTMEEVGDAMNITRQRVEQLEKEALQKLRAAGPHLFRFLFADHDPGAKKR
jgi:predicted DNA-binding protein (UPF0251 family)